MWEDFTGLLPTFIERYSINGLVKAKCRCSESIVLEFHTECDFFGEVNLFSFLVGYRGSTSWFLEGNSETNRNY